MVKTVLTALLLSVQLVATAAGNPPSSAPEQRPDGPVERSACQRCHPDVLASDTLHAPVSINACPTCHRVTSVERHAYELLRPGAALCTACHDAELGNAAVVHQPFSEGTCTGCHDPHGGADRRLLKASAVDDLCESCHADLVEKQRYVHGPVAGSACAFCHTPHASMHSGLLQDEAHLLCLRCHENFRQTMEALARTHTPVTSGRRCLTCHDPHGGETTSLLPANTQIVCLACHDSEIELPGGGTLANIRQVVERGTYLHGPMSEGDCSACHDSHGGEHYRMLRAAYPAGFYEPFAEQRYALCFQCHEAQLAGEATTQTHTQFRNGAMNLHFVHVNHGRKGRTCRVCHQAHAGSNPKLIRESIPFGGWELPIGFDSTDQGGRCAPGCHAAYEYNRVTPVEYRRAGAPARKSNQRWGATGPGAPGPVVLREMAEKTAE